MIATPSQFADRLPAQPFPYISSRLAFTRLANRIAGKQRPLTFTWNGQASRLIFSSRPLTAKKSWIASIQLGGHDYAVVLQRLPEIGWISPGLAGVDLSGLPEELACGVLEACFGEVLDLLSKKGVDVKVLSFQPYEASSSEEVIGWSVSRGTETNWMQGIISGDDEALDHLANLMSKVPVELATVDEEIHIAVGLSVAEMRCSIPTLKGLELQDVLLVDVREYLSTGACRIIVTGQAAGSATANGKSITIKQLNITGGHQMGDTVTAALPVDELEIQLSFLVGQTSLSLRELRGLAPGAVFELPTAVTQSVTICANGRAIGKGELLELGEHVGVRVTEFTHP